MPATFFSICNWEPGIAKDFTERNCHDNIFIQIKCEWYGHIYYLIIRAYYFFYYGTGIYIGCIRMGMCAGYTDMR